MADMEPLVLSLRSGKAKKLAHAIANERCQSIISYIAEHEGVSASQVAKALNLSISTVHYNIGVLKKAGLIKADEYHYSEKGRMVDHLSLVRRVVVLSPFQDTWDDIKQIAPVVLIALVGAGVWTWTRVGQFGTAAAQVAQDAAPQAEMLMRSVPAGAADGVAATAPVVTAVDPLSPVVWYLLGVGVTIALYLLANVMRRLLTRRS